MPDNTQDLLEKVEHGQPPYPVQAYLGLFSDKRFLHAHWHDELELTLVDSGEVVYRIDLEQITLSAGDLALLPPKALHGASVPPGGHAVTRTFVVHPTFVESAGADRVHENWLLPFFEGRLVVPKVLSSTSADGLRIRHAFDAAFHAHSERLPAYEVLVKGCLLQVLAAFLACNPQVQLPPRRKTTWVDTNRLKAVFTFVAQRYGEPMALDDVARLANLGVSSFCRFFKANTGQTFAAWLVAYRLRKARHLLKTTGRPLAGIAQQTGFGSVAYFTRCFRKHYGDSPGRWRKENFRAKNLSYLADADGHEENILS